MTSLSCPASGLARPCRYLRRRWEAVYDLAILSRGQRHSVIRAGGHCPVDSLFRLIGGAARKSRAGKRNQVEYRTEYNVARNICMTGLLKENDGERLSFPRSERKCTKFSQPGTEFSKKPFTWCETPAFQARRCSYWASISLKIRTICT